MRELPDGEGWEYEPKWDGFRGVLENLDGELALWSRNGRPLLRYFPELRPLGELLPPRSALDGEVVIVRDGALDFDAMQMRLHPAESRIRRLSAEIPAEYVVFDVLVWKGEPVWKRPLAERRAELERDRRGVPALARRRARSPRPAAGSTRFEALGLDGVVAKRLAAPVPAGLARRRGQGEGAQERRLRRRRASAGRESREDIATLLLGLYRDDGGLDYVGSCAVAAKTRAEVASEGAAAASRTRPDWHVSEPNRWGSGELEEARVRPELVVEVRYDKVQGNRFRHGTKLLRWRDDKDPKDCTGASCGRPRRRRRRRRRRVDSARRGSIALGGPSRPSFSKRGRSEAARRHMPCIGSPASAIRARIVCTVNAAGSTAATSSQRSGAETRASGDRAHRVGARDRPVAGVLAEVDEDADAVGDPPGRRRDALVADPPLDLLGERLREPAHLRERQLRPDRRQDVQPRRARGLRERARARARPSPRARRARSRARTATARRSSGRGRSAGSRAARSPARASATCAARCSRGWRPRRARRRCRAIAKTVEWPLGNETKHLVDVVRMLRRHALLVEELALDAVREALHVERPPPQVGEGAAARRRGSSRRGRPSSARLRERTACRGSRSGRRGGRCASGRLVQASFRTAGLRPGGYSQHA